MALKILAASDLHLGRTSADLPDNSTLKSVKNTLERLVNYALENNINVLCLAGDVVDEYNKYYEAVSPLQKAFEELNKKGISVYMVAGNHDYDVLKQMVRDNENVNLLGADNKWEIQVYNAGEFSVQFFGRSFNKKHITTDPLESFPTELIKSDMPTIGLLHCDVNMPESEYAPVESDALLNTPLDVWILGHIHKPTTFSKHTPFAAYPGSLQAMSSAEPGPHGALLIDLESSGNINTQRLPLSPVRYETLQLDVAKSDTEAHIRDSIVNIIRKDANKRGEEMELPGFLVYDIIAKGEHAEPGKVLDWISPAKDELDMSLTDFPELDIKIRKIHNEVQPSLADMELLAKEKSPAGKLASTLLTLQKGESNDFVEGLLSEWKTHFHRAKTFGTYRPLNIEEATDEEAKRYIMQECKRMLGQLIIQKQEQKHG